MKHPSFLIHFDKQIDDKWWLWVGWVGVITRQLWLEVTISFATAFAL